MQRPRILHIFSRYGEVGGEEICFHAITEALGAIADVTPFVYSTEELFHSPHGALTKMGYLLHNRDVEQKLRECLRENRYDAWIIHNTFPAMSPCVYELALHQPAPVIHYMHNYRSGCLNGVFYRDGAPCFSCQGGNYFPGIMHACWRKNAAYSSLAAAVLYKTRRMGAWSRFSSYIAISRRQRELLIQTGIPEDKIRVIPHFIRQNPAPSAGPPRRDVLYAGRLTQEKGVLQLVQAWELLSPPGRILYLMGDGPLRGELERYISSRHLESIRLTGFIPHKEQGAVRAACGLSVAPSLWEETFGMVVLESWLHGTPVIVTPNGGLPELITHGRNGWIAQEPSVESLAETLHTALKQEERWPAMGAHGQQLLSSTYSPAAWLRSMEALLGELRVFHSSSTPPTSADREWLYGKSIVRKLSLVPNPISSTCRFAGEKRNIIMAVGRWDDLLYKRPCLLMSTLEQALAHAPHWEAEIYGNIPDFLREWHGNLPEPLRTRIHLAGYIPNIELQKKQSQARISLCTSLSEGTHLASAEALCAGASVVGPRLTPQLNCLQWYVSHDSGTLSPDDSPESLSGALLEEIRAWDSGKRNPEEISRYWCSLLHAENSCKRIIAAYEAAQGGKTGL